MNVAQMIAELAARLEDLDKKTFTDSFKLLMLNSAQNKVANIMANEYLTELEVKETIAHSSTIIYLDGTAATNHSANKVIRGGQGVLRVGIGTGGVFATRLGTEDLKKPENTFYAASSLNPLYNVFQNRLYVTPSTEANWDVYYLKVPTELLNAFTIASIAANTITADGSQSLTETADYYNNAVVYCVTAGRYFVIYDDDGSLAFSVQPNPAAVSADTAQDIVTAADTFYFLTNDFDQTALASVTCDLNEGLHDLVVSFAEAQCWKMGGELERAKVTLEMALLEVKALNERFKVETGIGVGSNSRRNS